MSGRAFFDDVADALAAFLPPELREFSVRRTGRTLKIWFGEEGREHYEVQFVSSAGLRAGKRKERPPVLEIGFHAEHADAPRNDAAIAALVEREDEWRDALGDDPEAGRFVGHQTSWRRLSELWAGDSVAEPEAAIEAAERLADYIVALEPLRKRRATP